VAKKAEPYRAVFSRLEQDVAPGDEIAARFWGLAGWSMNWWILASEFFAIVLVLPFILGLHRLYNADLVLCGSAVVLLSASWWIRPVLVIAITRQRQLLCCRISRPFQRKSITQAPAQAASLGDFRRRWLYSQLRYRGPGTQDKTVLLNIPAGCRQAAQTVVDAASAIASTDR
jgi:hypothetical protein